MMLSPSVSKKKLMPAKLPYEGRMADIVHSLEGLLEAVRKRERLFEIEYVMFCEKVSEISKLGEELWIEQ